MFSSRVLLYLGRFPAPSQLPPHSTTSSLPSSAGYAASAGAAAALDSTNSAPPPRVTLRVAWSDVFLWSVLVNITANYPRLCGTNAVSLCALPWLPAACARDATASQIHPMSGGKKLRQTLRRYAALCFSTLEHVPCPRVHMPSGLLPMECHARIDLIQRAHTAPRSAPLNCSSALTFVPALFLHASSAVPPHGRGGAPAAGPWQGTRCALLRELRR